MTITYPNRLHQILSKRCIFSGADFSLTHQASLISWKLFPAVMPSSSRDGMGMGP